MTVLPDDAAQIQLYFVPFLNHPNQLMYNGQAVLSTFAGSDNKFGTDNVNDGWASVLNGHNVHFLPSFFVDPATFNQYGSWLSGVFNVGFLLSTTSKCIKMLTMRIQWNAAWPITVGQNGDTSGAPTGLTDLLPAAISNLVGTITTDQQYLNGLQGKTYITSVSPVFYTHYSPETYNKNWIYTSDDHLYAKRWETLVSNRDTVDIVEVISWNDYGESHYIGPIEGAQPNSQAWVDGFDHTPLLTLTKYYAAAFKTGAYPAIEKDSIVMWARPHSKDATATNDSVGKPNAWQFTSDVLWAVALLSAPAKVTLSTSPTNSKTFDLPAGANKISIPLLAGGPLHATIVNNGQTTVDISSTNYTFQPTTTETYNFNYFTLSSDPVTSS